MADPPDPTDPLTDRILALEADARRLEPDAAGRAALRDPVLAYAERFLEDLPRLPAYHVTDDLGAGIHRSAVTEEPQGIAAALELLREHVDGPGLNPASPGHLAYIPGGGIYASALGDYLADVTNRYSGVFYGGPGAVRLENLLLRWAADLVGYPAEAAGTHVSGGSLANLIALATARDAHRLTGARYARAVVYLSSQTHHCVAKSLRILGLGECVVRTIPLDERYRMRPEALDRQMTEDRDAGLYPWVVVASAGSTDAGAVDPLEAIGEVARSHRAWYHVDGAYGAFFVLTAEGARLLRGMERSDSIVLDPHKTLFLPYGSGIVLVRDGEQLRTTHHFEASYLQDAAVARDELAPAELSPELTRHFRALRLWLPLMVHGLAPFRAALEEKMLLARWFRREVAKLGFWVGPEPELSVTVYRYVPERYRGDGSAEALAAVDRYNADLQEAVRRDGRVFISSTRLDGRFTLRLAVVVFRTHLDTLRTLLEVLETGVARLGR